MSLRVLYRDEGLVAIHKPPDMLVHRTSLPFDRPPYAVQTLRDQLGRRVYPAHRLDRATAGVLLFALDEALLPSLMGAFADRAVRKTYLAVVRGYSAPEGICDEPLAVEGVLREARTEWRCLHRVQLPVAVGAFPTARYSLIALWPRTGRRHQIRRHLRDLGRPIVGDVAHGDRRHNQVWRARYGVHRLMLVAHRLELDHPVTGEPLVIEAPPDPELASIWARVGWRWPRGALR